MGALFDIERAALDAIADASSKDFPRLREVLGRVAVTKRENTGAGFFADLSVEDDVAPLVDVASPIGDLLVRVDGLQHALCLLLFFHKNGFPYLLEAYSVGGDDTSDIDFSSARFGPIGLWNDIQVDGGHR
jgi:hypothetical protein